MYHSDLELVTKALAGNTDLVVKSALEELEAALNERDALAEQVDGVKAIKLLLALAKIMDSGEKEKGYVASLEKHAHNVKNFLYFKGDLGKKFEDLLEPFQLLRGFVAIVEAGTFEDGFSLSDLEEHVMAVRTYLYIKGYYNPDRVTGLRLMMYEDALKGIKKIVQDILTPGKE